MNKNTQIETKNFTVKGNIIAWDDNIMPISNISMVSVTPKPMPPRPFLLGLGQFLIAIGILVFLICVIVNEILSFIMIESLICFIFGGILWKQGFAKYKKMIEQTKDGGNLKFSLNSGKVYSLVSDNKAFLESVYEALSTIIADSAFNGVYHFDISNCQIDNSTYERKDYISNTQIDRIINKNRVDHNVFENNANIRQG